MHDNIFYARNADSSSSDPRLRGAQLICCKVHHSKQSTQTSCARNHQTTQSWHRKHRWSIGNALLVCKRQQALLAWVGNALLVCCVALSKAQVLASD
jgi:hypothetical protein